MVRDYECQVILLHRPKVESERHHGQPMVTPTVPRPYPQAGMPGNTPRISTHAQCISPMGYPAAQPRSPPRGRVSPSTLAAIPRLRLSSGSSRRRSTRSVPGALRKKKSSPKTRRSPQGMGGARRRLGFSSGSSRGGSRLTDESQQLFFSDSSVCMGNG